MKNATFLVLLILSNFTNAIEIVRLPQAERLRLNTNFNRTIAPLIETFGSGDIVGNGGGLVEQNFMLAYHSIQTAIENCLTNVACFTSKDQKTVLREINQLFIDKLDNQNPLIFLRNKDTDNFFYDEFDQTQRVAKTGFSKEHPIFINLDIAGDIINDIPTMIGILTHELGHQIGIANHSFLDQLGAKVRRIWDSNWTVSDLMITDKNLSVRLFSTKSNFINAKLSYVFNGKVQSLNSLIFDTISCAQGETLYGFYLSNGHWERPRDMGFRTKAKMTYWLDIYCEDKHAQIYPVQKDLDILFTFNTFRGRNPVLKSVEAKVQ